MMRDTLVCFRNLQLGQREEYANYEYRGNITPYDHKQYEHRITLLVRNVVNNKQCKLIIKP